MKKDKIETFIKNISRLFDTENYTREITYEKKDDKEDTFASVITDTTYRIIKIKIYPSFYEQSKEEQCKTLIHEMSHSITEDLFDCYANMHKGSFVTTEEARHARENATEQIAYLLFELGTGKKQYFRDAIAEYLK